MPQIEIDLINAHQQISDFSCIPSAVEMVLKSEGLVAPDYYELQHEWQNRTDGSFAPFDNRVLFGLRFRAQFCLSRDANFPISALLMAIDSELAADRYIIISLAVQGGWHMALIYDHNGQDYKALTKVSQNGVQVTARVMDIRHLVTAMQGTDILTYESVQA